VWRTIGPPKRSFHVQTFLPSKVSYPQYWPKRELIIGVCLTLNPNVSSAHASILLFVKLGVIRRDWQIDMICSLPRFMRLKMDLGLWLVLSGGGSWAGNQRPSRPLMGMKGLRRYLSLDVYPMTYTYIYNDAESGHQQAEARSLYRSFLSGSISSKRPNNDLASSLCRVPLNLSVEGKLDCKIK
jgi:hypothetical protein